ncbi:thiamine-phosphate kinase [Zhihengliuella flava]|uniref:Thiamine-monophosphate kinase n=1 Tax=Zhihengliuella flava TaxID=1285193 RepID=A0A931GDL1_9MICC|nr:thiamine-phosphate kinase [Zhihengliuella flava]MBG6083568.1 thiamine-monophosphate kinase [Zhihengliuella flava]
MTRASESSLIEALLGVYRERGVLAAGLAGPGDDAAVVPVPTGHLVMTIDTITEDQDFRRRYASGYACTGYDIGWKSAAQNLADVAAMGAVPTGCLTSLSLTEEIDAGWLADFAHGFADALSMPGARQARVSGGDLGRGSELSVSTTAFGRLMGPPVTRAGAQVGDAVAVCGSLGAAAAGWACLDSGRLTLGAEDGAARGRDEPAAGDPVADVRFVVSRQLRPRPALDAPQRERGTALLDVSDGLLKDAGRVAAASGVQLELAGDIADREPVLARVAEHLAQRGESAGDLARAWAYGGGESHALLATFADGAVPDGWDEIGRVRERAEDSVTVQSRPAADWLRDAAPAGWDPFESS